MIFSNREFVCKHKKIDGSGEYQLMLSHYIKILTTKPGALRNSLVLNNNLNFTPSITYILDQDPKNS